MIDIVRCTLLFVFQYKVKVKQTMNKFKILLKLSR